MDMDLTRDQGYISYFNSFNNWIASSKPKLLLIFTILIVLFYLVMSGSSSPNTSISNLSPSVNQIGNLMSNTPNAPSANMSPSNGMLSLVEVFLWAIFLILILVNGMQYFFNMDIRTVIKNIFTRHPEIDIVVDHEKQDKIPVPEITYEKQVFHIPDNKYTYNDARAVCKAYGSRLASYKEVEDAYNRGAEWCGYGWSKDQLVLYPTQESTYKKLQKKPGYEHACGRPGVNGGFIANPKAKFGINCYGYKPEMTSIEQEMMEEVSPIPKTMKDIRFENKVRKYRSKLDEILVSPFNYKNWSESLL
jgi:hypothetical protein